MIQSQECTQERVSPASTPRHSYTVQSIQITVIRCLERSELRITLVPMPCQASASAAVSGSPHRVLCIAPLHRIRSDQCSKQAEQAANCTLTPRTGGPGRITLALHQSAALSSKAVMAVSVRRCQPRKQWLGAELHGYL